MDRVTKISACLVVACLLHPCCASAEHLRPGLFVASATWSGPADGSGGEGGADCGYQPGAVGQPPFSSMTTAGSESIFQSGMGCGSCYAVRCTSHASCSTRPVIVVLTGKWDGWTSLNESVNFDLSGTAFGAMAKPGQADELRAAELLKIQYFQVSCHWQWLDVAFTVDPASSPYYLAVHIEYESDGGDLTAVELMQTTGNHSYASWTPMQHLSGAVWSYNASYGLQAPISLLLTSSSVEKLAEDVIPVGWQPGRTYRAVVNY